MNKLNLDFHKSGAIKRSPVGWIVLVIGLLAAVWMVNIHNEIAVEQKSIQAELTRIRDATVRSNSSTDKDQNAKLEFQRAESVIEQLSFPWNKLFEAIEGSAGADVALLTVLPDTSTKTVELNGEAKDWGGLVSYIKRLEEEPFFLNVQLVSHQVQQTDPYRPIRFKLLCAWTEDIPVAVSGSPNPKR